MGSGPLEAAFAGAPQRRLFYRLAARRTVGQRVEPGKLAAAAEFDQCYLLAFARLEPHGGAGRDIEMHAESSRAVEIERRIGLEEMIMAADLHRPVAGIDDLERCRAAAGMQFDFALERQDLARHAPVLRQRFLAGAD